MTGIGLIIILFAIGVLILLLEIFIPSHGVLCIAGLSFLVAGIVKTFDYGGREAGMIAVMACLIFLPIFAFFAIKYWKYTPIGKRIAPPNPQLTLEDTSIPVEELQSFVGQTGVSKTPLRPVGICEFNGKRVSCVAEFGMIDTGTTVEGLQRKGANLTVREITVS